MTEAPAQTRKSGRTPRDMALSLVVLLIPVIAIIVAYRALYGGDTPVTVDPTEAIASAERAGQSPLPPATAPEGWRVATAKFRDGTLRIGYALPDGGGAQLIQTRGPADALVEAEMGQAETLGTVDVSGVSWQSLRSKGRDGLLREIGDQSVLIIGAGADLTLLAADYPR